MDPKGKVFTDESAARKHLGKLQRPNGPVSLLPKDPDLTRQQFPRSQRHFSVGVRLVAAL